MQEFDRFKSFASSLLSRSSKIDDLIAELENAVGIAKKGPETPEGRRVATSIPQVNATNV